MDQQNNYLDNLTDQELSARLKGIDATLSSRYSRTRYKYYSPNGACKRFIKCVGSNIHFINLMVAANGVGKTTVLCNILANICFTPNLDYFNYPLYRQFPFIPKGRIISDTTTITKTIIPEIKKWFPKGKYSVSKADKHYESVWKTHDKDKPDFEFDIMTYEQDVRQFESATLGFALFDEPPPEAIWKATIARMRLGGIIICSFTPLTGSEYFFDNYVTSADAVRY
jgi:phage terminase large subunit-like protein